MSKINTNLLEIIKSAHNKNLSKETSQNLRTDRYSVLNWFLYHSTNTLILGDAGPIFEVNSKNRFKSFDDNNEELINVFLPVSFNQLLVGTKYSVIPKIDVQQINKASASCSFELFICSENKVEKSNLMKSISQWVGLISDIEVEFYFEKMFRELEKKDSLLKQNE